MSNGNDLRIVVIGAGSASFGLATLGDFMTIGYEELAGSTIVLHDIDEHNVRRTAGVLELAMKQAAEDGDPAPFKVEATTDPKQALEGANYAIMSIEHGNRMRTWMQDYYVPRKYGSKQIYGENGGPGGAFHTWRQVPPMLDICRLMEDVCPDAWLFNYSNPVPRLTWALNKASKIKNVGLCHGIKAGIAGLVSILGVRSDDLEFTSVGLNHFYWMIKVTAKKDLTIAARDPFPEQKVAAGTDLVPIVRERGITYAEDLELPLIAELFRTYGYLTYPGQSHPGEYLPWADAICPSVKYDFGSDAANSRNIKEKLDKTLAGEMDNYWWVHLSGERAVNIIVGLEHDTGQHELAVNMPNNGAIANLIPDCVVETPATVDKQGIHQEQVGNLPLGIAQLCQQQVAVQELVVEAALTGDYTTAVQALLADGTIPSPAIARAILDEMLELQGDLLPQFMNKK